MLKLEQEFYDAYFNYYGKRSSFGVINEISDELTKWPGFMLVEIMNIAKTCNTLGHTYSDFIAEAYRNRKPSVISIFGEHAVRQLFNVLFYHLYKSNPQALESFLGIRFTVRDIYAEIAEGVYGESNEENIEKIKAIKTEHTYSVNVDTPRSRDEWFYNMAITIGSYARCHSRKIGAVLVRDKSVISTGYNGPPRGAPTCDQRWFIDKAFKEKYGQYLEDGAETKNICPRRIIGFKSGEGLGVCPAGHAERNALINAARLGTNTKKTTMYMTCGVPCTPCVVEIINAGVKEIVCTSVDIYDETAMYLLENSDLKVRLFDFLV